MPVINATKKEINFKIVYFGPGLSGKTSSLQQLHQQLGVKKKSKLKELDAKERTLFFDFLPVTSTTVRGYKTHFQVYTVPGQPLYENSRRLLLKGVDGIIFVADSQLDRLTDNIESIKELAGHLKKLGEDTTDIPLVIQYNKRDLPGAAPIEALSQHLNFLHAPEFETSAKTGSGILTAFQTCLRLVLTNIKGVA